MKYFSKILLMTMTVVLACFFVFQSAWASVAANTRIVNQASLTYNNGTGNQTIPASVAVTVSLVHGIPVLNEPADGSTPYVGAATQLTFAYYITANGNGPDTYTIGSAIRIPTQAADQ